MPNHVTPVTPDEINDLLATPAQDMGVDERTEGEVRGAFAEMARLVGPQAFMEIGMKFLLANEVEIRANSKPGDAALERLNQYYRERETF